MFQLRHFSVRLAWPAPWRSPPPSVGRPFVWKPARRRTIRLSTRVLHWRMLGPFRGGRTDAVSGRARPAQRVLLGLGERRRVEVGRRRPRLGAGIRRAAGRIDRRDRRRGVGT